MPYYDSATLVRMGFNDKLNYPGKSKYWWITNRDIKIVEKDNYVLQCKLNLHFNYMGIYSYRQEKVNKSNKNKEYFYTTFLYIYFAGSQKISLNYLRTFDQINLSLDREHQIRLGCLPDLDGFEY